MRDVSPFPFQPRRLRHLVRVGATIDDTRNLIAKFLADIAQSFGAAAIFHRVMQQGADRFGFIGSVLKRDRGHAKNMGNKGNPGFLPRLITVRPRRINQSFLKLLRQLH